MAKPLRVLMVEDCEDDALLLLRELARAGYLVTHRRVQTKEDMREALKPEAWDAILSDFSMPAFSARRALDVLKESGVDIPFIIVSGTIGEETAVAALKAGAHDFLLKTQLARFVPALERELREAEGRRERRKAVEALRQSERKYRRIVETAQEGIWMIDADGRTTYVNRRMAEMLGAPTESLIGASFFDFVSDVRREEAGQSLDRRRQATADQREFPIRRRDQSEFVALVSTNPITDDEGRYIGALAMVTDVTEQRKLQEQLMVSDRMASIGTLAAGVAHEINNPLSTVLANLQLGVQELAELRTRTDMPAELRGIHEGLLDAVEATDRVRSIVRDLKLLSHSHEEKRGPVDLTRIVESSIRMASLEIRHRAKLVKDLGSVPLVMANESRVGQVCLNLLVNAAQAIDEGHVETNEIRVTTRSDTKERVILEITDTGSGMPPEVLKRLFTPFFTTKPAGVGTGLGLSICHRIIASLGGEMEVESVVGKGTTFRVVLPAADPAIEAETSEAPVTVQPSRRGRILVVDDEPLVLSAVRRSLATEHDVTATTSGREALERIALGERFDVILCDLMMPHVTGMDFYEKLRELDQEQTRRVVFVTSGAVTSRARAFLDRIENTVIAKPFDPATLRAAVNERLL